MNETIESLMKRIRASIERFPLVMKDVKSKGGTVIAQAKQVLNEFDFIAGPLNRFMAGGATISAFPQDDYGMLQTIKAEKGARYRITYEVSDKARDYITPGTGIFPTDEGTAHFRIYHIDFYQSDEKHYADIYVHILDVVEPEVTGRNMEKAIPLVPIAAIVVALAVPITAYFVLKSLVEVKKISWSPSVIVGAGIAAIIAVPMIFKK